MADIMVVATVIIVYYIHTVQKTVSYLFGRLYKVALEVKSTWNYSNFVLGLLIFSQKNLI